MDALAKKANLDCFWPFEVTGCLGVALLGAPKAGRNSGWGAQKSILRADLGLGSNSGQDGYLGRKSQFWPIFGSLKSPVAWGLHCSVNQ